MVALAASSEVEYYYAQGNTYLETQSGTQTIITYSSTVICPNCNVVEPYLTTVYPEDWRLISTEQHLGDVNGGDAAIGYHYTYLRRIREVYQCPKCSHTTNYIKEETRIVKNCPYCS